MKLYYGNYVGIVLQNNDPEREGKIKVYVPHVTATVYKKWIEKQNNKKFKFLGKNIDTVITQSLSGDFNQTNNLTEIVEDLKQVLPWAQCAAPLISENSSGRYNSYNSFGNISDSNYYSTFSQSTTAAEETPGKPGSFFEKPENRLTDAFINAGDDINRPNPLAYEYVPSTYSNRAKGSFGVPAVGSHVWVFFRGGNPTLPVYFAASYGKVDWEGIYEAYDTPGMDYPGAFENKTASNTDLDVNVETYRSKYVINQKGGAVEIINTDLKERIKLTHYSGSFKEFNNQANIELATNNDQKLVLNDAYETVRGFKNEFVGKDLDENVKRDKYKKVGSLNAEYFEKWKDLYAPVQDLKQLFEIQRALPDNIKDSFGNIVVLRNSPNQTRVGSFAKHPAINQEYYSLDDDSSSIPNAIAATESFISNSTTDGPSRFNVVSDPPTIKPYPPVDRYTEESGIKWQGIPGQSVSSQDGNWVIDPRKDQIKAFTESILFELTQIEKQLGIGGSEIVQISKHKVETIGLAVNNYGAIRFDNVGKMLSSELLIDDLGSYINYQPSPMIEMVHVQDLPGGDYTLNVCNRYNLLVGSGGINIKTSGNTNITGAVTNIAGEQVNLSSSNEININAKTVNIGAEILRLRNKNGKQIYIENSLGVNNNVVIGGGLSVEGEVFLQHVTAPAEYQLTQGTQLFGTVLGGAEFKVLINIPNIVNPATQQQLISPPKGGQVYGGFAALGTITVISDAPDTVASKEHTHLFKNIPLTLYDRNVQVRQDAKVLNNNEGRVLANRRVHGAK
jgi:hypothetical protein